MSQVLQIQQLTCINFRCFDTYSVTLDAPCVVLEGINGAGKTSLLEALYYACYFRSFRTSSTHDLIKIGAAQSSIKIAFHNNIGDELFNHELYIGIADRHKSVKLDAKNVRSHKEILEYYRVLSLTENDLHLIQDAPAARRTFIDNFILLCHVEYAQQLRTLRHTVDSRNALLVRGQAHSELFTVTTQTLWQLSQTIARKRQELLDELLAEIGILITRYFEASFTVSSWYEAKNYVVEQAFDAWYSEQYITVQMLEGKMRRTMFGAHLDDFKLFHGAHHARFFSSRGQQKLIVTLLKIAQIRLICKKRGAAVFLIDDFMLDFDQKTVQILLTLLQELPIQLIFTTPILNSELTAILSTPSLKTVQIRP